MSLADRIEFILTHPNSWEGEQQAQMRKAAIMAGLIPDNLAGHERIHFVTEGEASLHFCVKKGLATDPLRISLPNLIIMMMLDSDNNLQQGKGVIIVDAGGGTVDISTYRKVTKDTGEVYEEIAPAACKYATLFRPHSASDCPRKGLFQGSIFVSERAREFLKSKSRSVLLLFHTSSREISWD